MIFKPTSLLRFAALLAAGISAAYGQSQAVAGGVKDVNSAKTEAGKSAAKPVAPGLVVFKDPVTGQIRQPDASEIGALVNSAVAPSSAVVSVPGDTPLMREFAGPGTAVGIRLDDSFMSSVVVSKGADGKLNMDCVPGDGKSRVSVPAAVQAKKPAAAKAAHDEK